MTRRRVAVLISGRGSNLKALIDALSADDHPAEIVLVVSNRPDAKGLLLAADAGLPAEIVDHKGHADRAAFEHVLDARLRAHRIDLVCLAGFMRLLTAQFVTAWRDRILNIHPSLLPAFPGLDTHARALAAGVRFAGCTVHVVRPEMDAGPIVAQAVVPVMPDDDETRLAARVLAAEHRLYPMAVRLYVTGAARVQDDRVAYRTDLAFPSDAVLAPTDPVASSLA